jgi:predicted TIM-barrel fold metal-dependent hydrolase
LAREKLARARGGLTLVFFGDRRSGKTSILYQLKNGELGDDFVSVFVDLQGLATVTSEDEFYESLAVEIAAAQKLWLHAHSDAQAIEKLFALDPKARILWAHAGMSEPPEVVDRTLGRHTTLWADLSYRDVAPGGTLDPAWKALFLKYPDRFIYGSDTWIPSRWEEVDSLTQQARGWLAQLPLEVAENIAWRNAERIFGKK